MPGPYRAKLKPMRLVTGPAGSGKTTFVLDRLREALRTGDDAVRLLAPTATMAQHLEKSLAREGFVFRRRLFGTMVRRIGALPVATGQTEAMGGAELCDK